MGSELTSVTVDGPDSARIVGHDTLEILDRNAEKTYLFDLNLIVQVTRSGRI
jgi:hypothetical protein